MTARVALLTAEAFLAPAQPNAYVQNVLHEDDLLVEALAKLGYNATRVAWTHPHDWRTFDAVVVRSTWDYSWQIEAFLACIAEISEATHLINAHPTLVWNLDKHYLADLARANIPVVPTHFVPCGAHETLASCMDRIGADHVVVKPAVSSGGRNTHAVTRAQVAAFEPRFAELLAARTMMVQPFQPAILTEGEVTLVAIAGAVTHAVRKVARPGEFRVQESYGGSVAQHTPSADERSLAERALQTIAARPLYGRVDIVRTLDGSPAVMELELVEPELWLRFHPPAAILLAQAIAAEQSQTPPAA